jgi:hypothetical protein
LCGIDVILERLTPYLLAAVKDLREEWPDITAQKRLLKQGVHLDFLAYLKQSGAFGKPIMCLYTNIHDA